MPFRSAAQSVLRCDRFRQYFWLREEEKQQLKIINDFFPFSETHNSNNNDDDIGYMRSYVNHTGRMGAFRSRNRAPY